MLQCKVGALQGITSNLYSELYLPIAAAINNSRSTTGVYPISPVYAITPTNIAAMKMTTFFERTSVIR